MGKQNKRNISVVASYIVQWTADECYSVTFLPYLTILDIYCRQWLHLLMLYDRVVVVVYVFTRNVARLVEFDRVILPKLV